MISEQWDKEREKEEEVETKQGERMGEKADGCFWCDPLPILPLSLPAEPRPCLIVLIIFRWPFHTKMCQYTQICLLFLPLFTLFVVFNVS